MCGVARVAISFGGGETSEVEPGTTSVLEDSAEGAEVIFDPAGSLGSASWESLPGEQAHRISIQKRSVRIILRILD